MRAVPRPERADEDFRSDDVPWRRVAVRYRALGGRSAPPRIGA
jgi:hypothetical protein